LRFEHVPAQAEIARIELVVVSKDVAADWSINGITRLATGLPITLSESGDRSLTGGSGVDRPNYIGGLVITSDVRDTPNHTYFNKSAFTQEDLGGQGTAAPRFFHAPGQANFDLAVQKITTIRESI
jgi:hypothetical protein